MDNHDLLPNALVVGVPKAGTTSLYRYLMENKHVYFPSIKEPHFFVHRELKGRIPVCIDNWTEYTSLFSNAGNSSIIGEASVFYFYYHSCSIREIKNKLGSDIYIVVVLRNPVDRAFSAYRYAMALNKDENLTFSQALKAEKQRIAENKVSPMLFYVDCGLYAERLECWMNAFRNMKVILFDDLVTDPGGVLDDVFRFFGIENKDPIDYSRQFNTGFGGAWKNQYFGKIIKIIANRHVRDYGKKLFPGGYEFIKNKFLRIAMTNMTIAIDEREYLIEKFYRDIEQTSKVICRDLRLWM